MKPPGEKDTEQYAGVGIGTAAQNTFLLFVGPKDTHLLQGINPKLDRLVDWGTFGIIAKPLFQALNYVADHWTGAQLGLVDYPGHADYQHRAFSHPFFQPQIFAQDAEAATAVEGDQREIQEHQD